MFERHGGLAPPVGCDAIPGRDRVDPRRAIVRDHASWADAAAPCCYIGRHADGPSRTRTRPAVARMGLWPYGSRIRPGIHPRTTETAAVAVGPSRGSEPARIGIPCRRPRRQLRPPAGLRPGPWFTGLSTPPDRFGDAILHRSMCLILEDSGSRSHHELFAKSIAPRTCPNPRSVPSARARRRRNHRPRFSPRGRTGRVSRRSAPSRNRSRVMSKLYRSRSAGGMVPEAL